MEPLAQRKRQRKRRITEDERVGIALARFECLQTTGMPTPLEALSRRFGRDEVVISRLVSSALKTRLIEVRTTEGIRAERRQPALEHELLRKYPMLRAAIVVEAPAAVEPIPARDAGMLHSDIVHRRLGAALANEIVQQGVIGNACQVGIGPGRGVYETIRALVRNHTLTVSGVTLVSLSGVGYLKHHARNRNLLLDPDFTVVSMGEAFEQPVTVELVSSPLVVKSGGRRNESIRHANLDRAPTALDVGILGVGALCPGHRFYMEGSPAASDNNESLYDPIRASLRSLLRLAESLQTPDYIPVGDIGYHLFFVPPPRGLHIAEQVKSTIIRQIDSINDYLLSAHGLDLGNIRAAILVAGTLTKARAIHFALVSNIVKATCVCTDTLTARKLLSLET